jgi:hypothetical protein
MIKLTSKKCDEPCTRLDGSAIAALLAPSRIAFVSPCERAEFEKSIERIAEQARNYNPYGAMPAPECTHNKSGEQTAWAKMVRLGEHLFGGRRSR